MMTSEQHKRLSELRFLSGDLQTADQFEGLYQKLLNNATVRQDKAQLSTMRQILLKQAEFLLNEFLRAQRDMFPESIMKNVQ